MNKHLYIYISIWLLCLCSNAGAQTNILDSLLKVDTTKIIQRVMRNSDKYRVQIIYTQINRDKNNQPFFTQYNFRLKPEEYFYPASMVKLPIAAIALEKIKELKNKGIDANTPLMATSNYKCKGNLDYYKDKKPESVNTHIQKMFLVSDNDSYNTLYEFIGQKKINKRLQDLGYGHARVIERIAMCDTLSHRTTGPVCFYDSLGAIVCELGKEINSEQYSIPITKTTVGKGNLVNGKILHAPKDFKYSNYLDLQSMNDILKSIVFPNSVEAKKRFDLTKNENDFLMKSMSTYPRESKIKIYADEKRYYDGYMKYFLSGGSRIRLDTNIRIFNKVGLSYGFMVESAYIVDYREKIEFILSAVIYCNENEILNDGKYEYDKIGFPFMKRLGWLVYNFERARKKQFQPTLKKMDY